MGASAKRVHGHCRCVNFVPLWSPVRTWVCFNVVLPEDHFGDGLEPGLAVGCGDNVAAVDQGATTAIDTAGHWNGMNHDRDHLT